MSTLRTTQRQTLRSTLQRRHAASSIPSLLTSHSMDTKNIIIAVAIAGVAVLGVLFPKATNTVVEKVIEKPLGALSSPDIMSPYISFGGVRQWAQRGTFRSASTTIASIQSPVATSTLLSATCDFDVSSTSASTVTFAKDTDESGSSTPLQSFSVSAGAQAHLSLPATTTTAGMSNLVFAPSSYFNVTMGGGNGTYSPTGGCNLRWVEN